MRARLHLVRIRPSTHHPRAVGERLIDEVTHFVLIVELLDFFLKGHRRRESGRLGIRWVEEGVALILVMVSMDLLFGGKGFRLARVRIDRWWVFLKTRIYKEHQTRSSRANLSCRRRLTYQVLLKLLRMF